MNQHRGWKGTAGRTLRAAKMPLLNPTARDPPQAHDRAEGLHGIREEEAVEVDDEVRAGVFLRVRADLCIALNSRWSSRVYVEIAYREQ